MYKPHPAITLLLYSFCYATEPSNSCKQPYTKSYERKVLQYHPEKSTHTADGMPIMKPLIAGVLYQIAYHLAAVLDKHQIRYWVDSGTALGMIRHGGLIPHDDDIDLCIFPGDDEKLNTPEVIEDLLAVGLNIRTHWIGAKVFPKQSFSLNRNGKFGALMIPCVDLFFTKRAIIDNEIGYEYSDPKALKTWPNFIHKHTHIFDSDGKIRKGNFGPIKLNAPSEEGCHDFCARAYGENFMNEIYIQRSHMNNKSLNSPTVQLTDYRLGSYIEWDGLPSLPYQGTTFQ